MKETQWERAEDCPEDALEQARQQEDALFAQALEKQQRKAEAPYSDIIVTQCMLCVGLCLGVLIWNHFAPESALRWLAYCREQLHQLWGPELLEPFLRLDLPVYA